MVRHISVLMRCGTSYSSPCISMSIILGKLAMDCHSAAPMRYVSYLLKGPILTVR